MSAPLSDSQRAYLLELARRSVEAAATEGRRVSPDTADPVLLEKRGAFVTLKSRGRLRGCIGYPLPFRPLADAVAEMAAAAATEDTRFSPIEPSELAELEIEISALTVPHPVASPREIIVGRHGIIVSKGPRKGLLLPQVPGEYGWDLETYLRHGCLKAGLPEDEWKKGARIEVFEAEVFSEAEESRRR
jgi:AmmeMemoRadiSam system protein A